MIELFRAMIEPLGTYLDVSFNDPNSRNLLTQSLKMQRVWLQSTSNETLCGFQDTCRRPHISWTWRDVDYQMWHWELRGSIFLYGRFVGNLNKIGEIACKLTLIRDTHPDMSRRIFEQKKLFDSLSDIYSIFYLAFFLKYILTFYLRYILTLYLAIYLTFHPPVSLPLYVAYIPAFDLT